MNKNFKQCTTLSLFCKESNLFLIFLCVFLLNGNSFTSPPKIEGSFLRLDFENANWSVNVWKSELEDMRNIQIKDLIIQHVTDNGTAYYPTILDWLNPVGNDPIAKIMSIADTLGMKVYIGLAYDGLFWQYPDDSAYLEGLANRNIDVINELWDLYEEHSCFEGWYIPQEISDYPLSKIENYVAYIDTIADYSHWLSSSKLVLIAPFFAMHQSASDFEIWWRNILDSCSIDVLMLQDGVGCDRCTLSTNVPEYFYAMKKACDSTGTIFWTDLEIFTPDSLGWKPGDMNRIAEQIEVESLYVSKIVCYEYNHFMGLNKDTAQMILYRDYAKYLEVPGSNNIAYLKPYILFPLPVNPYTDSIKLTNGHKRFNWDDQVGWNYTDSNLTITIDLLASYDLERIKLFFMRSECSGIYSPQKAKLYISNDNITFTYFGDAEGIGNDESTIQYIWFGNTKGRYLKTVIIPETPEWTMLSEIEVYKTISSGISESHKRSNSICFCVFPNPFTHSTTIEYEILARSKISLKIYDISGQLVETLIDERRNPGYYTMNWKTKEFSAGVYFAKFEYENHKKTRKLIILK